MTEIFKDFDWRGQVFPKREGLTDDLTTIDFLKAAALTLMIVDHVGYFLFPEIEWFRVLGRLCVPLWFFLIGYANARDVPGRWFAAVIILFAAATLVAMPSVPLSILVTMALSRVMLDPFWNWAKRNPVYFWWVILLLLFFGIPTGLFIEYGTTGFVLALTGYAVRHRQDVEDVFGDGFKDKLIVAALTGFGILQAMDFGFSWLGVMVLFAGLLGIYFVLEDFKSRTLPGTAGQSQAPLIRFMGRYTLDIYVIHLLLLYAVVALQRIAALLI